MYYTSSVMYGSSRTGEATAESYGIKIIPKYIVYLSIAGSKDQIVTSESSGGKTINSVIYDEGDLTEELDGKAFTVKVPVSKGFVKDTSEKLYVVNKPDPFQNPYCYIYDTVLTNEGGNIYATFTITDEFYELDFSKNPLMMASLHREEGKELLFEYLGGALFAAKDGETIYLTEAAKNLTEEESEMYLACYGSDAKTVKIDKSNAPDAKVNINEYGKYKAVVKTKGNIITYTCVDKIQEQLNKLTLSPSSSYTNKKTVKVSLNLNKTSKAAIKAIKNMGYKVKYEFYRSTKKGSGYALVKTSSNPYFTNLSGKKGTTYYYKVRVIVTEESGWPENETKLSKSKYTSKKWKK